MAQQGNASGHWKSKLAAYTSSTEENLKSVHSRRNSRDRGSSDLDHRGSLAELRSEVATAKRLSSNANSAITDSSAAGRPYRPASAPRSSVAPLLGAREPPHRLPPSSDLRSSNKTLYFASPTHAIKTYSPRNSPAFHPAESVDTPSASAPSDALMRVLDSKMDEMSRRLEMQIDRNLNTGSVSGKQTTASAVSANDSLLLLGVSRSEAAERSAASVTQQLTSLEKHHGKGLEDLDKRVTDLQESNKQHWERICSVVSQVEAMQLHYKAHVETLPAAEQLNRLESRLSGLESSQARGASELEEQQRLMLALTTAVQRAGQEAEGMKAGKQRQDDLSKQLEASLARIAEVDARVSGLSSAVLAIKARELEIGVNSVQATQPTELAGRLQAVEEQLYFLLNKDTSQKDQQLESLEGRLRSLEHELDAATSANQQALAAAAASTEGMKQTQRQTTTDALARDQDINASIQDMAMRMERAEEQLSGMQLSGRALGQRVDDIKSGSAQITASLGSVGDQLEALMAAQERLESKADVSRVAVAEERLQETSHYIEHSVRPGLEDLQSQLKHVVQEVARLEREQAAGREAAQAGAAAAAQRGVPATGQVTPSSQAEPLSEVQQLTARVEAMQGDMQALRQQSEEELDRSQRLMAAAEEGLTATQQGVRQALLPLQELQRRVEELRAQQQETQEKAVQAAQQAAAAAEALALVGRVQEQQQALQERVLALQQRASQAAAVATGPNEQVQALQGRLDADWFLILEQDQIQGAPITHAVHGQAGALQDLEDQLRGDIDALKATVDASVAAAMQQAASAAKLSEEAAAAAAAAGAAAASSEAAAAGSQEVEELRCALQEQEHVLEAARERIEEVAVQFDASLTHEREERLSRAAQDSKALDTLTEAVDELYTGLEAERAARITAASSAAPQASEQPQARGPLLPVATTAIAAAAAPSIQASRAAAAAIAMAALAQAPASKIPSSMKATIPVPADKARAAASPTQTATSVATLSSTTTAAATLAAATPIIPAGLVSAAPTLQTAALSATVAAAHTTMERQDASDSDNHTIQPVSQAATLTYAIHKPNAVHASNTAQPPATLELSRNWSLSDMDGLSPPPKASGTQPLPAPEVGSTPALTRALPSPSVPADSLNSPTDAELSHYSRSQDHLQAVEALLTTREPTPTSDDRSPGSLGDVTPLPGVFRPQPVQPLTTPHRPLSLSLSTSADQDLTAALPARQLEEILGDMQHSHASLQTTTQPDSEHSVQPSIPVVEPATASTPVEKASALGNLPPLKGMGQSALPRLAPAPQVEVQAQQESALPKGLPPAPQCLPAAASTATYVGAAANVTSAARERFKRSSSGSGVHAGRSTSNPSLDTDIPTDDELGDVIVDDDLDELPPEYMSHQDTGLDSGLTTSQASPPQKAMPGQESPPPSGQDDSTPQAAEHTTPSSLALSSDSADLNEMSAEAGRLADMLTTPGATGGRTSLEGLTGARMSMAGKAVDGMAINFPDAGQASDAAENTGADMPGADLLPLGNDGGRELEHDSVGSAGEGGLEALGLGLDENSLGSVGLDADASHDLPGLDSLVAVSGDGIPHVRGSLGFGDLVGEEEGDDSDKSSEWSSHHGSDLSSAPSASMMYTAPSAQADAGSSPAAAAAAMNRNPLALRRPNDGSLSDDEEIEVFARPGATAGSSPLDRAVLPALSASGPQEQLSLEETSAAPTDPGSYMLVITTGGKVGAGMHETLHVTLHGDEGSGTVVVPNPGPQGPRFQRGGTDVVRLEAGQHLGDISELRVWHTGQGFSESWNVERVLVQHPASGTEVEFVINDWVRGGQMAGRAYKPGVRQPGALSQESSAASIDFPSTASTPLARAGSTGEQASGGVGIGGSGRIGSGVASSGGIGRSGAIPYALHKGVGGRAGYGDESMSLDLDTEEDSGDDELPIFGISSGLPVIKVPSPGSAVADGLKHRPPGVVLDEDVEDVSLSTGLAWNTNPLSMDNPVAEGAREAQTGQGVGRQGGAQATTPRAGMGGRPPLPPTPTQPTTGQIARSGSVPRGANTQLTAAALGLSESGSMEGSQLTRTNSDLSLSLPDTSAYIPSGMGSATRAKAGRKVRTFGGEDDELARTSIDSWDSVEMGVERSQQSLTSLAPGGVRPPTTAGTSIGYLGTSGKRVSFSEYSEQFDFPGSPLGSDSGSVASLDEEDLIRVQRGPQAELTYDQLLDQEEGSGGSEASVSPVRPGTGGWEERSPPTGTFRNVPLRHHYGSARPNAARSAMACRIKVFTADRMNAGLGSSTVHLEVLGNTWIISQALPKAKGAFQRGCVDRFAVTAQSGELGEVLAIKVWHEGMSGGGGPGRLAGLGESRWCLNQVVIENKMRGVRYVFCNSERGGWLAAGRRHAVVLKPQVERLDELEDLRLVQQQVQQQIQASGQPDARKTLASRLNKIGQMIGALAKGKRPSTG